MTRIPERKNVKQIYKWDLTALIDGDAQWETVFGKVKEEAKRLSSFKGALSDDGKLLEFFRERDAAMQTLLRLYLYAHMSNHTDTRADKYQKMKDRIDTFSVEFSSSLSFVSPEICLRSAENLRELAGREEFSDYSYELATYAKNKDRILSENEEKIISETGAFSGGFQDAFNMFDNADVRFRDITLNGKKTEMSHGVYGMAMQSSDRAARQEAFNSMFEAYKDHVNTIAALYAGNLKKDWFYAKLRKYPSCLERELDANDVEPAAYTNLIKATEKGLKTLHAYMRLRKKVLGYDKLNMWDLHTALVDGAEMRFSYEKAFKTVKRALEPLGEDYQALLDKAYSEGWIDVMENRGKRSGAYSWATYGVHPYVLLNHKPTLNSVFTVAHELGHAMHSYYSNSAQPFAKSDYVIFVAEIASTVNEVLLLKYLLEGADKNTRKYLLGYYLDMFRTTLFRQTMFAEFELRAHTLVENGSPVTAEALSDIYYGLNKKYYGSAVTHNDLIRYEWARIPHFYNSYYVYQYATGLTAAVSIAADILKRGKPAVEAYKKFLSAGGSMPPMDILRLAGVDLACDAPYDNAMAEFKKTLAELGRLFNE